MLCAMLSGPRVFDSEVWLRHVNGGDNISDYYADEPQAVLQELLEATQAAFVGGDLDFQLLLPDDEVALAIRAAAFAAWCRGYLSGLGLAGIADLATLGEDARGFLADVERFGMLAIDNAGDEDDERALIELTEFTRIGVLLLHAELLGGDKPEQAAITLH